jgi:methyl-accepting chemotaxis protein
MSFITKLLGKIPLKIVLIVPFALQTSAVVVLVGYLSFKNGQKAVNDIASQLRSELTTHITQQLENYIKAPFFINQLNVNALARGEIDVVKAKGEHHFWQQAKMFPSISYIYCGSPQNGEFFGVGQEPNKTESLQVLISNNSTGYRYYYYGVDSSGNRTNLQQKDTETYDARTRPWYKDAIAAGEPTWSEIYLDFATALPTITASVPVYDKTGKSLMGVCATDLFLPEEFNKFLRTLKIGKSGQTFVVDRAGVLVSSSTEQPITVGKDKDAKRLKATESSNPIVRETGQYLNKRFSDLSQIQSPQQLDFLQDGKQQFVQVTPFKNGRGLDWLIVLVIPESDFMGQINANTRTTILLCIAALIVAILISILTSLWVTQPLVRLNLAVKDIALGQLDKTVDINRSDEVGQLAKSFNDMAMQLKDSFDKLNAVISQANQVGMKVTSSTRQITTAGKQLEATVTQQAVSTNEVKATASSIASTSGELAKTIEDLAQKAQATADQATNSQASLSEMASAMHQLATATTLIATRLGIMHENANNINSVVTTIAKVADQINLISLNAAIEAEKAGEYGAGFAVVAKEVKRLADSTTVASQEIEQMVKEIQSSVSKGVREMDKFSQQVSQHVEQVGRISGQMTQVIFQVQSLTPQFEEVSHSMSGQFEGARQISTAISHLSEASQQTLASLQQTNQVLDQLNDTTQVLQGIISSSGAE